MKIIFAGTPEPAAVALEHLLTDQRIEVAAVITQPDAKRGRGRTLQPSKVADVAENHGIPVYKWPGLKSDTESGRQAREVLAQLAARGVTAAAVVAYGNLIPADLLHIFTHGWINLHFSVLPRWRGAAPVQAAIAAGDDTSGASVFRIEEGMDTGPVIDSFVEPIGLDDTADDVLTRLTYAGRELLADALVKLDAGTATFTVQQQDSATHAPKITTKDAHIDWTQPCAVIQRVARAHTPAPGAWTLLGDQRYKIGMMAFTNATASAQPGELVVQDGALLVGTGDGQVLEIRRIQSPGKKMMDATDWLRGNQQLLQQSPQFSSPQPSTQEA
ncbi:methionyl-tRNA formyltransferase [Corynebacterium anserum]|uniref:Methionyl-tRNA formyltransferase n=1 Tax=Corynebacterium anserum TaxID=2684406 RepID=A0A7G7YR19_9CORY|nr:methionyl-tRNA formyltransferase [Corynebacterium anserum]MBC2681612.1 methionyl-tRNA formyltransferase [Corynebacterium anserum]QNH96939.1 methionyl-tRNA formyltransferase [Corynebacterium anserum]